MRAVLPSLLFATLSFGLAFGALMAPPDRGAVAVVFPVMTDELTAWSIVRAAGAQVVGPTRFGNIVVAYSPDLATRDRMQRLGALFFLAATGLCSPTDQKV